MRALNAFVADVYADQRIVAEQVMPRRVIETADHYEPAMAGVRPASGVWIGIAGLDIVRDGEGAWLVLEDNVRTPSGLGYWPAARQATLRGLELPGDALPLPIGELGELLRRVLGPGRGGGAHGRAGQRGLLGARAPGGGARRAARRAG